MWSVLLQLDGRLTQRCIEVLPDWSIEILAHCSVVHGIRYTVSRLGNMWINAHSGTDIENFAWISHSLVVCSLLPYAIKDKIKELRLMLAKKGFQIQTN